MNPVIRIVTLGVMVPALIACGSVKAASKSNSSQVCMAWPDTRKGLCTAVPGKQLPFTQSKKGYGLSNEKWANALADAGLLSRKDVEVKGMPAAIWSVYALGQYKADKKILSQTTPPKRSSLSTSSRRKREVDSS